MNLYLALIYAWSVIAVVGICVCAWALGDGYLDLRAIRLQGVDGVSRLVVLINLRSAVGSLVLHSFFFFLGARSLTTPGGPKTPVIIALAFVIVAAVNVAAVAYNQVARLRLRRGKLPA